MENNEEQNLKDKSKELKKGLDETKKLAANMASGNVLGAIKNAIKLAKNKKVVKQRIITIALQIIIPCMLIACLFAVFASITDKLKDFISNLLTPVSGIVKRLTDDYWIDLDERIEYIVDAETGETLGIAGEVSEEALKNEDGETRKTITETDTIVDRYIKDLGNLGVSLKDLRLLGDADYSDEEKLLENEENKVLVEKYIAEFIRADLITQQPHRRKGSDLVNKDNQNKIDGSVYLYRTKEEPAINENEFVNGEYIPEEQDVSSTEYKQMTYISYEDFTTMVNNNDSNIRYYFSIDPDTEELVLAEIKTTVVVTDDVSNLIGSWFANINDWLSQHGLAGNTTYEITEIRVAYKEYIAKYIMPYEFLINLCQVTQNPEFVYHVALLARESKIILGVQDDTTIDRVTVEVEEDWEYYKNISSNSSDGAATGDITKKKIRTVTTTTTQTPMLRIEYADTWSFYEEFEYTKMLTGELTESVEKPVAQKIPDTLSNYHPAVDASFDNTGKLMIDPGSPEYWDDTFLIETRTKTQSINTTKKYSDAILKASIEKSKQFLGLLRNSTGTCEYDCFEVNSWKKQEPEALKCVKEAEFERSGINVQYRIPNRTKTESPISNLLSGLDMLYALLQSNSSGYENLELTDEKIKKSYDKQEELINSGNSKKGRGDNKGASEDYESAYVVKMQGLVEHLRYLMSFPENETYDIKKLHLDNLFGDDEEYDYDEGFNYGFWWPVNAENSPITSKFGWRYHPVDGKYKMHNGIDIGVPTGTQVIATANGTVTYVGTNPNEASGLWIKIDHGNGFSSVYMHLSEIKVKKGQVVSQGEVIALSGNTGKSTGAHLHFGISVNGTYVDPLLYVSPTNRKPEKVEISSDTSNWRMYIEKAFSDLGYTMTEEKVSRILSQISTETGGNQNSIQGIKDINSGTKISINNGVCPWCPNSRGKTCGNTNIGHGLLQFIPTTFEKCKISGHGDIFNGYDQICALIVNAEEKNNGSYRHIGNGTGWSPK